jgi:outer membrane biosynthesis protein TonB
VLRPSSSSGRRPPGFAIFSSVALHLSLFGVGWWLHTATFSAPVYETYEITIVSVADPSRPEVVALPEPDPLVVETPDPQLPAPEPEPTPPPPTPTEDRVPVQRPDPVPPVEQRPAPEPRPQPERPAPTPQTQVPPEAADPQANVDLAVRMEGLQRDFPAYYARILAAMQVCWRQPPGIERASATVRFAIERDGSIRSRSIVIHARSGIGPFDVRAVEAVECAGQNQRIPALPDEITGSSLPVQFTFTTSGFRE